MLIACSNSNDPSQAGNNSTNTSPQAQGNPTSPDFESLANNGKVTFKINDMQFLAMLNDNQPNLFLQGGQITQDVNFTVPNCQFWLGKGYPDNNNQYQVDSNSFDQIITSAGVNRKFSLDGQLFWATCWSTSFTLTMSVLTQIVGNEITISY